MAQERWAKREPGLRLSEDYWAFNPIGLGEQSTHRYQFQPLRSQPRDDARQSFRGMKTHVIDVHHDDRARPRFAQNPFHQTLLGSVSVGVTRGHIVLDGP